MRTLSSTLRRASTRFSSATSAIGMRSELSPSSREGNWPTSSASGFWRPVQRTTKVSKRRSSRWLGPSMRIYSRHMHCLLTGVSYHRDIKTRLIDSQPDAAAAGGSQAGGLAGRGSTNVNVGQGQSQQSSGGCCS